MRGAVLRWGALVYSINSSLSRAQPTVLSSHQRHRRPTPRPADAVSRSTSTCFTLLVLLVRYEYITQSSVLRDSMKSTVRRCST